MQLQGAHSSLPSTPEKAKVVTAAREFEAMLLTTLLNSLQKDLGSVPGEEGDSAAQSYGQFGIEAIANGISAAGGLGISRLLVAKLLK